MCTGIVIFGIVPIRAAAKPKDAMDREALIHLLSTPNMLLPGLTLLAGLAAGLTLGRMSGRRGSKAIEMQVDTELANDARDLRKTVYILQNENRNLSTFLMTMPDLARRLNSRIEKRKIPELLIGFIQQLFEAEQIAVFLTSSAGGELILADGRGLAETGQRCEPIPFGKGRLGWVAVQKRVMDENDFLTQARLEPTALSASVHPFFRVELCAPMAVENQTFGVISIGGLLRRPKNEKNMLKMVADLGSIAMQNEMLLRQLQDSADSDGLTGLKNKRNFQARLADEMLRAKNENTQLSLFLFDIDHFKNYNDTNGHVAGDEALRLMSRLIQSSIRPDDLAARYGGEEFVVLLPRTDKAGALAVAEKLRSRIEAHVFPHQEKQPLGNLTISGGVANYPYDAASGSDLIRCADKALYEGKHAGRNRVLPFEPIHFGEDATGTSLEIPATDKQGI